MSAVEAVATKNVAGPKAAKTRTASAPVGSGLPINIDNGGTLTDICVTEVFDIVKLMNARPIPGGKYSSHDMGVAFEPCGEGETHTICQGSAVVMATCWNASRKP